MRPEDVPPSVVLRDGVKPLVRYLCVPCGRSVIWVHEDEPDGRPIWGYELRNVANRLWPGGPGNARKVQGYLDEPSFRSMEFGCKKHHFHITRAEMLEHFQEARASRERGHPSKAVKYVRMDRGSPWWGPLPRDA